MIRKHTSSLKSISPSYWHKLKLAVARAVNSVGSQLIIFVNWKIDFFSIRTICTFRTFLLTLSLLDYAFPLKIKRNKDVRASHLSDLWDFPKGLQAASSFSGHYSEVVEAVRDMLLFPYDRWVYRASETWKRYAHSLSKSFGCSLCKRHYSKFFGYSNEQNSENSLTAWRIHSSEK